MAISIDATSYSSSNSSATVTWSHVVGVGDNRVLLVLIGTHLNEAVTGVTYGGVALTLAKSEAGNYRDARIYYLVNPTSGTDDIVVSWNRNDLSSSGIVCSAISLDGAHQTSPITDTAGENGDTDSPSVAITSTSNDLVLDIVACSSYGTSSAFAEGEGQTEIYDFRVASDKIACGVSTESGAESVTMSWTISGCGSEPYYAHAAVSVASSPVTAGTGTLPSLTIVSSADGVVESLPLFSLVNCYVDVPHSDVDESLPIFTISATAIQDTVIAGDCTLPVFTMSSTSGFQTSGDVDVDLPVPTASASSLTGEISEGDCDVPFFTISATLLNGGISQGVATLPIFTFVGKTINTGTASESVPVLTISAYAHGPLLHTLDETLPLLQIVATLVQQSTAFRCYVMNTENSAITEYDNFPFNSFCTFKGKHLAAGSNGITLLEGNKDNSTDIKAYLNVGNNDFDLPNIKKVTDAYLSMKGDGSYYLTVTSDDGTPHDYLLTATTGDRIKNLKTNVGKGKKGRYFELELSNIAGADFELYDMVLNVELLKRNI